MPFIKGHTINLGRRYKVKNTTNYIGNQNGKGNKGRVFSKEHKEKLRQAKLKNPNRYWLGKKNPKMTGNKNPRWLKDRSVVNVNKRRWRTKECIKWRNDIFKRDDWKCKIADENCKGKLEAHHILRWSEYPELRFEINNGITLCYYHHPRKKLEEIKMLPTFQQLIAEINV